MKFASIKQCNRFIDFSANVEVFLNQGRVARFLDADEDLGSLTRDVAFLLVDVRVQYLQSPFLARGPSLVEFVESEASANGPCNGRGDHWDRPLDPHELE